uniref:Calponin-homology (CH) domain-containing protein n=1 Tax=Timema monikensis TaxID=170555 RepID=A0A7R9HU47_9NEOP|nr:unnamed protein product [Timema monikensis]
MQEPESSRAHGGLEPLDNKIQRNGRRVVNSPSNKGCYILNEATKISDSRFENTEYRTKFSKLRKFMEKLENCNYAVELGKQLKFSLVGIAGQDLNDGNATLTLALIWQLMRAYTLSVLTQLANTGSPIVEKEIVTWDPSIADARVVIDLLDAIKPGTIHYEFVKEGGSEEMGKNDSQVEHHKLVNLIDIQNASHARQAEMAHKLSTANW